MADILHKIELDQPIGKEPHRPLRMPGRWIAASQGDDIRFLTPIQYPHSARTRPLTESSLQAVFGKSLAYPGHCARTHPRLARRDFIFIAVIYSKQEERALQPSDAGLAATDQSLQL